MVQVVLAKQLHLIYFGGMDSATSGSVIIDGKNISKFKKKELTKYRREDIGFVFQFYNLVPNLTAIENVELATQICKKPLNPKTILEKVGLKNRMKNFPSQLSGGEQQRASIARTLAINPKIIFMDEPTSALDPELVGEVLKVVKQLAREKRTMVIVTHEISFAREIADRVIFMSNGEIIEQGKPEEVIDNPKKERTKGFLKRYLK